jgi:hypothetical protein
VPVETDPKKRLVAVESSMTQLEEVTLAQRDYIKKVLALFLRKQSVFQLFNANRRPFNFRKLPKIGPFGYPPKIALDLAQPGRSR